MGSIHKIGSFPSNCHRVLLLLAFLLLSFPCQSTALDASIDQTLDRLLEMSLEELMQVEVAVVNRRPTKLQYVAENISIVTAEDIRAMNANSVREILRTVTGLQVESFGGDFGDHGAFSIHSSSYEHVLVLLDGVRLNDVDAGYPETGGIPVQIIDCIEIVKGPASSAWGSALGGVINIVTRQAGTNSRPNGTLYGSYGENSTQEYRADAAGKLERIGYYLYGGYMYSDGLINDRYFENKSFYTKLSSEITDDVSLTLTGGYWYPDYMLFDWPAMDYNSKSDVKNYLITGKLDAGISSQLQFSLELYFRSQKWHNLNETITTDALISDQVWDNNFWGGNAALTWKKDRHTMLFGAELDRGNNDRTWLYPSMEPISWQTEKRRDWAVYFNDTIIWERLALIPGVRFDHLSIEDAGTSDIISPSLGATYTLNDNNLLRATAARGFIKPGIGLTVGSPEYAGDPGLEPEDLWSFQAGIESTSFRKTHLKADVFYHHQDDTWYWNDALGVYTNGGTSERTGFEINAETSPLDNLTAGLGFTYIQVSPYQEEGDDTYGLNLKLGYHAGWFGNLILFGRYYWWNEQVMNPSGKNGGMIWDLHYNRNFCTFANSGTVMNLFVSVRNLFNGTNYTLDVLPNPDRWVQAGLRIDF